MVTRSLKTTPFGLRLTYSIDGESSWTEYIHLSPAANLREQAVLKTRRWTLDLLYRLKTVVAL